MSLTKIVPQVWMLLPTEERNHLSKVFGLVKNGVAEIRDQTVISDGHSADDLLLITKEKMEEYIGSTVDSFYRAWEITISKCNFELYPPINIPLMEQEIGGDQALPTNTKPNEKSTEKGTRPAKEQSKGTSKPETENRETKDSR